MASKAGAGGRGGRIERLPNPLTLEQFDMGITLGTGSFGRVRFAVHKVCTVWPWGAGAWCPADACRCGEGWLTVHFWYVRRCAVCQPTRGIWAIKMLKKAEVVRLQQVWWRWLAPRVFGRAGPSFNGDRKFVS